MDNFHWSDNLCWIINFFISMMIFFNTTILSGTRYNIYNVNYLVTMILHKLIFVPITYNYNTGNIPVYLTNNV